VFSLAKSAFFAKFHNNLIISFPMRHRLSRFGSTPTR